MIATGTAVLNLNQVYHLQFRANIHDTTGIVQVKVDGVVDIDFSGDTKPGTETTINAFQIGQTAVNPMTIQFDNVVIDGAAWPGKTNIQAIRPDGAGNSTQWTPSAGANWDCVDEVPASDADNVVTNTNDQVDLYAAGNLVGTVDSVVCVQVQARAVKEGVATPQNLALGVRTGATDYFSSDKVIPTAAKSALQLVGAEPEHSRSLDQDRGRWSRDRHQVESVTDGGSSEGHPDDRASRNASDSAVKGNAGRGAGRNAPNTQVESLSDDRPSGGDPRDGGRTDAGETPPSRHLVRYHREKEVLVGEVTAGT